MPDVVLRAGDTDPPLDVQLLEDDDETPVDTITADEITINLLTSDRAVVWSNAGISDSATPGRVTYQWQAGDTDRTDAGLGLEFVLDYPSGTHRTLPTRGPLSVAFLRPGPADYLPIQPDEVATEAGIGVLTPGKAARLARIIRSVAGEMEAFLGYSPAATQYTEQVLALAAWNPVYVVDFPPIIQVISAVPTAGGQILLTYLGGYDVERTPALRSYLVYAAAARFRATLAPDDPDRLITSLSVEGQSVSYSVPTGDEAGAPPTLQDLTRYKRRSVFARRRAADPFAATPTGVFLGEPLRDYGTAPGWTSVDPQI